MIRQLEGLAREKPVIVVFEDAHWLDPTSRELLDLAVERVRSLPVLLIVTFRPEFQPPWAGQPQVGMLALNRLDRRDCTALVAQVAGRKTLPDDTVVQIAERDRSLLPLAIPACLAVGVTQPPGIGAAGGAGRRGDRAPISLCAAARRLPVGADAGIAKTARVLRVLFGHILRAL